MAVSGLGLGWLWDLGLKGAGDRQRWRKERQLKSNKRQYQRLTISDCCGWYNISFVRTPDSGGDWPWIELSLISKLLLPRLISPVCGSRSWLLACWTVIQTEPRLTIRLKTVMFWFRRRNGCPVRTMTTFSVNLWWDLCHRPSRRIIPVACQQFRIG